jgi:replicative DNA helicase
LRELQYRGIQPNPIFVDYINLMKPENKTRSDLYQDVKFISEQLRAMSLKFNTPIISVSQLNRGGMSTTFDEVDFVDVAESVGLPATADSMFIFGQDEDALVYESELHYKIVKNRLGGRVGEQGKMYIDKRSLKMYDVSEFQVWLDDCKKSGDVRDIHKSTK